jgi:DNA (cytosine-5)-methyltransferase 1
MRHGSLFSGIGGFELAAEWTGWTNIFHCEWNKFGQQVLKYHFPKSISYEDITKTDFSLHRGDIDILTGGFPCQPYSMAGKRLGKEDERHLWPEMLRVIRETSPRYVVGENVRGLVNWDGGLVFDEVQADLEALGYEVLPVLLPACAVGAPHRRDRIWFVAYCDSIRQHECKCEHEKHAGQRGINALNDIEPNDERGNATNANKERLHACTPIEKLARQRFRGFHKQGEYWENFPTQPPICGGDDGLSYGLDGITFPKWRNESIKAYGNAIVPQVAHQIFKAIQEHENNLKFNT